MIKLIDAHTHNPNKDYRFIENLDIRRCKDSFPNHLFSIGVHPWLANSLTVNEIENILTRAIVNNYFCALGEIGLDKKKEDWDKQLFIFELQLDFAIKYDLKNIIIHCVNSFNEIYQIIKSKKYPFKILWHDFNGNKQIIEQLMQFDSFFSIGKTYLLDNSKISKAIQYIPKSRILIESDDSHLSIEEIYDKVSKQNSYNFNDLVVQLNDNFDLYIKRP